MKRVASWVWSRGIVSTFMTGLFVLLPIMITVTIMGWAGGKVVEMLGPSSLVGNVLRSIGLKIARDQSHQWVGTLIGWALVLVGIWLVGACVKSFARQRLQKRFHGVMDRIPVVSSIYRPVSQVVDMLKGDDDEAMKSMRVVHCKFGDAHGGGFLALLSCSQVFRFGGQDCLAVYIPTSPLPMSGGIILVPVSQVTNVDMSVEDLMQIYFSLGVMAPKVMPQQYMAPPG